MSCRGPPKSGFPNEANISATEMPVSSLPLTLPLDTECALKRIISALAFPAISGSSRRFGSEMISLDIPHVVSSTDSMRRSERDRTGIGTLVGMAVAIAPSVRTNSDEVIATIGLQTVGGRRYSSCATRLWGGETSSSGSSRCQATSRRTRSRSTWGRCDADSTKSGTRADVESGAVLPQTPSTNVMGRT